MDRHALYAKDSDEKQCPKYSSIRSGCNQAITFHIDAKLANDFSETCLPWWPDGEQLTYNPVFRHYDIDLGSSFGRITSVLPTILKLSVRY
jgi:hypothetical protein